MKMVEEESEKTGILCLKSIRVYGTASTSPSGCRSISSMRMYSRESDHIDFVDHVVTETDTLQGLSIRYDVTMEEIKRCNQLWSNDSSCVRQKDIIRIPLKHTNGKVVNSLNSSSNSDSEVEGTSDKSTSEQTVHSSESPSDFFGRIDASISRLKGTKNSTEMERTGVQDFKEGSATMICGSMAETSLSSLRTYPSYQNY